MKKKAARVQLSRTEILSRRARREWLALVQAALRGLLPTVDQQRQDPEVGSALLAAWQATVRASQKSRLRGSFDALIGAGDPALGRDRDAILADMRGPAEDDTKP